MSRPGIGRTGAAAGSPATFSPSVVGSASRAVGSSQPLAFIASTTTSGGRPAAAWATIQSRSSGVTIWVGVLLLVLLIARNFAGAAEAASPRGPFESPHPRLFC